MKKTALITGASSGIGLELSRLHAKNGDNLVISARRGGELEKLKAELESEYSVSIEVVTADLSLPSSAERLVESLNNKKISVDYLINNAGFGALGPFKDGKLETFQQMIQVNVTSLMDLTHLILPSMVRRGEGKVLHVASVAAFVPGPLQAVYFATKAFVLSFSLALAQELKGTGVTSTALCPGPVKTSFFDVAKFEKDNKMIASAPTPASVAQCGYNAMMNGKLLTFNDPKLGLMLEWIIPFLPRSLVLKTVQKSMQKF